MWPPTLGPHYGDMNSSSWYIHHPIDIKSRTLLSDRQLTERASWLATLRSDRIKHRK
jgi:hypothetical protein